MVAGLIGGLVSWIGALLNTWQLASKTWFVALLLLGIFSLGFFAMVAYVMAGAGRRRPTAASIATAAAGARTAAWMRP